MTCASLVVLSSACATSRHADRISVVVALYPLEFLAETVGGDGVSVTNLVATGAEPHDIEVSQRDATALADADVVVIIGGLQPSVDESLTNVTDALVLDLANELPLRSVDGDVASDSDDHDHEQVDPHFWLDPQLYALGADAVAEALSEIAPRRAESFRAAASALGSELDRLDATMVSHLADCRYSTMVTSHDAFGYLARRVGLRDVGISGISTEGEPSPRDLADIADTVRSTGVTTIYSERLLPADVADAVARETGAVVQVLDPIESRPPEGYFAAMTMNVSTLRVAQECGT